jgi:peptidoglycan/LPS O-acetylase OafA/YrhL
MIITTALFVSFWAPDTIKRFLTDAPFSIFGAMNWWLVFRHTDYFESIGRPPLLQHTWSLGVEAQFYLLWPLILLLVLRFLGKNKIPGTALLIACFSGLSLLLLSLRVDSVNAAQVSHVYFGTDTHSIGLFLGAALAVKWVPQNLSEEVNKKAQDFIDGIGIIGFLGIIATFLFINESDPTLYKLAFPLAGIFGCAIITSVVHPASRFAPILSSRFMVCIGERSYAIYLWHWIIFQITRPAFDLEGSPWALFALRILIVFALSDISLRLVELPIRTGALEYWFKGMKYRTKEVRTRQRVFLSIGAISLIAITTLASAHAINTNSRAQRALIAELEEPIVPVSDGSSATSGLWVTGDSVILGIRHELDLRKHIGLINARVGRQAPELLEVIIHDKANAPNSTVILNLGNNNKLTREQVVRIFEEIKNQPKIIAVNTAVPRGWREDNNSLLREVISSYPNAYLVDWESISLGHPEYFAPDGVHLVPTGVIAYVDAITQFLK